MKCNRRAGHSRVASLAALPQFTFCPHPALQYNVIFTFILNSPFSILHYVNRKINLLNHWAFSPIMRFERGLSMKNKRMRYISITAAILLVFVLLMLLFSNR